MNINDIKTVKVPNGCLLKELFMQAQEEMADYGTVFPVDLNTGEGQKLFREFAAYTVEELMEGVNALKNRPWNQSQVLVDIQHVKEELSDALHFFIALCNLIGLSHVELFEIYMKKKQVNNFRRESGY